MEIIFVHVILFRKFLYKYYEFFFFFVVKKLRKMDVLLYLIFESLFLIKFVINNVYT